MARHSFFINQAVNPGIFFSHGLPHKVSDQKRWCSNRKSALIHIHLYSLVGVKPGCKGSQYIYQDKSRPGSAGKAEGCCREDSAKHWQRRWLICYDTMFVWPFTHQENNGMRQGCCVWGNSTGNYPLWTIGVLSHSRHICGITARDKTPEPWLSMVSPTTGMQNKIPQKSKGRVFHVVHR